MQHEPSPAAVIAAALGERAEAVCRQYLPHGRRQGRYWVAGDLDGARGRSLFVRLAGPGTPGKFTDAATGQHGDLLDLIRHRSRAPTLRAALDEARAFLALPPAPDRHSGTVPVPGSDDPYDATEAARRLWRRCRAVAGSHAERYLHARGLCALPLRGAALPSRASLSRRLGGAPLPGAGRRRNRRRRQGARHPAHLARSAPARQGGRRRPAQGARAHPRPRRALRRAPRRSRFARRRRGHRDRPVARHRRTGDPSGGRVVRGQPRRVRAAARRRAPGDRPRQ